MGAKDTFFELINVWANEQELYSVQGTVKEVSENVRTCTVTPSKGGPDILDVRLEADFSDSNTDSKGFFVVPKVGSIVGVSFFDKDYAFISVWSEIDKVILKSSEFTFNDGDNGGMMKSAITTQRLNNIEDKINDIIQFLNTHIHTSASPGNPTTVPTPLYTGGDIDKTVQLDLENESVKH